MNKLKRKAYLFIYLFMLLPGHLCAFSAYRSAAGAEGESQCVFACEK